MTHYKRMVTLLAAMKAVTDVRPRSRAGLTQIHALSCREVYNDTKVALAKQKAAAALLAAAEEAWDATFESYNNELATFPDVRESQRDLARARTLDQAARAEVWTRAGAFAFATGDLAWP